jgi:intracellular protein transport protein USO1
MPVTPLLHALIAPPASPLDIASVTSTHLATLLFSDLVRFSSRSKALARSIVPQQPHAQPQDSGSFFVPADGAPPPGAAAPEELADDDEPQSLLQIISEHLALALLSRRRADASEREAREWDRLIVGYLCLLAQWLWEDPPTVRAFLEAGALGMVGICALLLRAWVEYSCL